MSIPTSKIVTSGSLSGDFISNTIKAKRRLITKCYEQQIEFNPQAQGKITLEFIITKEGTVKNASVFFSSFPQANMNRCMRGVIDELVFPKPPDGEVRVRRTFVFKVERESAQNMGSNPNPKHKLSKWFKDNQRSVDQCIEKNAKKTEGKLVVKISLKDKKIHKLRKVWSTFNPRVDSCILAEVQNWPVSANLPDETKLISHPITFQ